MKLPEPDIVQRDRFLVMGTVTRRQPGTERAETAVAIWRDFELHHDRIKAHSTDSKFYGVSFAAAADGSFDYLAGMAVEPVESIPAGLAVRTVPAATYAVFACPAGGIGPTYAYIFGIWRFSSGYELEPAKPVFEQYPRADDTVSPVLIHVPIRAKKPESSRS